MEECLTVNKLMKRNSTLKKSFEKWTKQQCDIIKKDSSKKIILQFCGDNKIYQIPLSRVDKNTGSIGRLIGFFIKSCFHIVAYDEKHNLFPSNK